MNKKAGVCCIVLLMLVFICFGTEVSATGKEKQETVKILLVGNSLTKYGSHEKGRTVESHLKKMTQASGKKVVIKTIAHGGARLKYWADDYKAEFLHALTQEEWDYVVLQEYSKTPYLHYEIDTVPAVKWLKQKIEKEVPKAKILLYMPHGYDYSYRGAEGKIFLTGEEMTYYTGAAHARLEAQYGIEVIASGLRFYRARLLYPDLQLLGKDNWHPTKKGYFLAASCIYYQIFDEKPLLKKSVRKHAGITRGEGKRLLALLDDELASVKVTKSISVGESFFMEVTEKSKKGKPGVAEGGITDVRFRSLQPDVAVADEITGEVKAVGSGQAVIVAETADGVLAFCTVFAEYPKVTGIKKEVVAVDGNKKIRVQLTWNQVPGATYRIYRAAKKNGNYKLLATVAENGYTDKTAAASYTWYYKIVTLDGKTFCEHRASKAIKVKVNGKD